MSLISNRDARCVAWLLMHSHLSSDPEFLQFVFRDVSPVAMRDAFYGRAMVSLEEEESFVRRYAPVFSAPTRTGEDVNAYMDSVIALMSSPDTLRAVLVIATHVFDRAVEYVRTRRGWGCDVSFRECAEHSVYVFPMETVYRLSRLCCDVIQITSRSCVSGVVMMACAYVRAICMRFATPRGIRGERVYFTDRSLCDCGLGEVLPRFGEPVVCYVLTHPVYLRRVLVREVCERPVFFSGGEDGRKRVRVG